MERGDALLVKNVKMNKVSLMAQELGQQPGLAFGNSSGDASMMTYTFSNNPYQSMAFLVVNDDTQREYGEPEKSTKMKAIANKTAGQSSPCGTISRRSMVKMSQRKQIEAVIC